MLHRDRAALVVVDVQSRLLPTIHDSETTLRQIVRSIRGFQLLGAPVIVTEQYRRGLGATHPAIQEAVLTPHPRMVRSRRTSLRPTMRSPSLPASRCWRR